VNDSLQSAYTNVHLRFIFKLCLAPSHLFRSSTTRYSPLTCAALPALARPPIPGAADRVWVLMRRAWVEKWCVQAVAAGVGGCCRRQVCLLNYSINVILSHKGHRVHRAFLHFSVISVHSVACIKMLSSPHPILTTIYFPTARPSPLPCAALPALARPPITSAADRVWVFMRRAWVGKWCVQAVAAGVGGCCRRRAWLLKYKIQVIYRYNPDTAARQGDS